MAVLRRLDDTHYKLIPDVDPEKEAEFVKLNPGYIQVDDNKLPDCIYGYFVYDSTSNTFSIDLEKELSLYKQELIERMDNITKNYILDYYPHEKQLADAQQQDFYGTAILMIRQANPDREQLSLDQIYMVIGNYVNAIWNGETTLQDIISAYPEDEQYYWEQLIKAGLRKAWVVRGCVYVFNQYKLKVLKATTLEELESLDVQTLDFAPFPEWLR